MGQKQPKSKLELVIENFVYNELLNFYRDANIREGGDIEISEQNFLENFGQMFRLGANHKRELVIEELRAYTDFHALKEGDFHDGMTKSQKEVYFKAQDDAIDKKLEERMQWVKKQIKKWS